MVETVKHILKRGVAARYGVTVRTIDRWHADERLGFPKPLVINQRNYYREDELDAFDRQCARRVSNDKAA